MNRGILYVVATPIGNLQDITLRAIEVLKSVDLIACEDTRHTGVLLKHLGIETPMVSYFQHSKLSKIEYIIEQLLSGKDVALVTDAGTPGISDPGQELIHRIRNYELGIRDSISSENKKSHEQKDLLPSLPSAQGGQGMGRDDEKGEIEVIPIPGASALAAAASVSGMIEKEFYFAGFLPKKKGRMTEFKRLATLGVPIVVYESAMRLERTLEDIRTYFGSDVEVFIAREMTKLFEEYWGGSVDEVISGLGEHQMKGELALVIKKGTDARV